MKCRKGEEIMKKKAELDIVPIILGIFFACLIGLLIYAGAAYYSELDQNEAEIGLRIQDNERECYDFCDGEKYYYSSGDGPDTCNCKPTLVRIEWTN